MPVSQNRTVGRSREIEGGFDVVCVAEHHGITVLMEPAEVDLEVGLPEVVHDPGIYIVNVVDAFLSG